MKVCLLALLLLPRCCTGVEALVDVLGSEDGSYIVGVEDVIECRMGGEQLVEDLGARPWLVEDEDPFWRCLGL